MPREPASTALALAIVGEAFVVVVVGGMGSIGGAYIAALAIGVLKALCVWLGTVDLLGVAVSFPKLTQVIEFLFMAVVLAVKPQGLLGRRESLNLLTLNQEFKPLPRPNNTFKICAVLAVAAILAWLVSQASGSYAVTLATEVAIAALFAMSLHFLLGTAGMPSFGHAALFGVGAYTVGVIHQQLGLGIALTLVMAASVGAAVGVVTALLTAKMTGVYRAMLTLAIAQLLWSASYQWDGLTGGSNGLTDVWADPPWNNNAWLLWLCMALLALCTAAMLLGLRSRLGLQLRALRDAPARAASLGLHPLRLRMGAFAISGWVAALAGALYALTKGTVAPDVLAVHQSVNGLIMVLLGGVNSLTGALTGAAAWTLIQDILIRQVPYWRAAMGSLILLVVLYFPYGISGVLERFSATKRTGHRSHV